MSTQPAVLSQRTHIAPQTHPTAECRSVCERQQHSLPRPAARRGAAHTCLGSTAEKEQLLLDLLPLVRRIALRMREHLPSHVELDDLVSAGMLGLIDAVRKFDPAKHVQLKTYATHRVRGAILDSLRDQDAASRDMRKKNKKAEKMYRELEAKLGRPVQNEEIADALGMSLNKWYRTVNELQPAGVEWLYPTDVTQFAQPDEESLVSESENAFDHCYRREQKEIVQRAMACLSERERRLIGLYYHRELTMKEIGTELGVDESRVSQLHSAAVGRLKARVKQMCDDPLPGMPPAYVVAELYGAQSVPARLAA